MEEKERYEYYLGTNSIKDNKTNKIYDYVVDILNQQDKENQQLKQQLAEKDKEYQSFKKIADENVNYLKNRILEETRSLNQDKISFAVEQLEKVKEFVNEIYGEYSASITTNFIDNQINELKGKVEDVKD